MLVRVIALLFILFLFLCYYNIAFILLIGSFYFLYYYYFIISLLLLIVDIDFIYSDGDL